MVRLILTYIILISILVSFTGCDFSSNYSEDCPQDQQIVYLSITKTQAAGLETFNDDNIDFEDRVHDLAMLVFDSYTGDKIAEYFDEGISSTEKEKSFTVELTRGLRDFYFVANMPMAALKSISTRSSMDTYMSTLRDLDTDLYLNAKDTKGFPMARVYKNQTISEGGNIYSPMPFRPNNEDGVRLLRVVAKLEVKIDGSTTNLGVKSIYYKNAYKQFSLSSQTSLISPVYYEDKPLKKVDNTYIYYMPEALMSAPSWQASVDHKPINYFVIETLDGTIYQIPIITYDGSINEADYLSFATGTQTVKPDYNIYRNRHYYYTIKKLQTIEILYNIDPWQVKQSATYMGYGYNVEVDENGKITISNTIEACSPHAVKLQTVAPFTFSDNSTEQTFTSLDTTASIDYMLNKIPNTGDGPYLKVLYNDALVKTFSK
ncbi:MAG: fimbrial protein [Dysgonomonas sp.]